MVLNWKADKEYLMILTCDCCHEVFRNPQRLPCGHSFCMVCLAAIKGICLNCGKSFPKNKVSKDILASNLIEELKLKCDHGGCEWEGNFEDFKNKHRKFHLKSESQPISANVSKRTSKKVKKIESDEEVDKN